MRTVKANSGPVSRGELAERIRDIEAGARQEITPVVSLGWPGIDAALAGGLRGHARAWGRGLENGKPRSAWVPPLLLPGHLAGRANSTGCWFIWVGKRLWLHGHAAMREHGVAARSLWVDAPDEGARLWAADAALRTPGVVVIADGSGFDTAASRRLQLAAAAGGTLGVIARPAHEIACLSMAATRWVVSRKPASGLCPRFGLTLIRCKGWQTVGSPEWIVERQDGGLVCVSPDAARRSGAAVTAS